MRTPVQKRGFTPRSSLHYLTVSRTTADALVKRRSLVSKVAKGVDSHDFRPWHFDEIQRIMRGQAEAITFTAALPCVTLVPVTPRIHRELGLAIRDPEHAAPTLRAFVRIAEEVAAENPCPFVRGTCSIKALASDPLF